MYTTKKESGQLPQVRFTSIAYLQQHLKRQEASVADWVSTMAQMAQGKCPQKIPRYPKCPQKIPRYPKCPQKIPRYPKCPQKIPRYPKCPQKIPM
jgi:hypothetical protein